MLIVSPVTVKQSPTNPADPITTTRFTEEPVIVEEMATYTPAVKAASDADAMAIPFVWLVALGENL